MTSDRGAGAGAARGAVGSPARRGRGRGGRRASAAAGQWPTQPPLWWARRPAAPAGRCPRAIRTDRPDKGPDEAGAGARRAPACRGLRSCGRAVRRGTSRAAVPWRATARAASLRLAAARGAAADATGGGGGGVAGWLRAPTPRPLQSGGGPAGTPAGGGAVCRVGAAVISRSSPSRWRTRTMISSTTTTSAATPSTSHCISTAAIMARSPWVTDLGHQVLSLSAVPCGRLKGALQSGHDRPRRAARHDGRPRPAAVSRHPGLSGADARPRHRLRRDRRAAGAPCAPPSPTGFSPSA